MDEATLGREIQKFNVTDAAIADLSTRYMVLKINGLDDKDGFAMVHKARMDVKERRIAVEKTRKELKEDALRYGQAIDKEAKRITALLEPIENHLAEEEGKIQAEKDRIKAEADAKEAARIQSRIDTICAFGPNFNGQTYAVHGLQIPVALVKVCTDEQFTQFIAQVQAAKDAEDAKIKAEEDARRAEADRLAKVAAEQEAERQRLAEVARKQAEDAARAKEEQEAAQRKAGEEKERVAKEQAAREAKIKEDAEAAERKIREEREALEAEKKRLADAEAARLKAIEDEKARIESERIHAEEVEKARKEAAEKAVQEAKEKAQREAAELAEAERKAKEAAERKAARQPDKVKLSAFIESIESVPPPEMKTDEGRAVLAAFQGAISLAIGNVKETVKKL